MNLFHQLILTHTNFHLIVHHHLISSVVIAQTQYLLHFNLDDKRFSLFSFLV